MAVLMKSDSDPLPHSSTGLRLNDDDVDDEEENWDADESEPSTAKKSKAIKATKLRRVSFPVDEHLVTGYVEPPNPWEKAIGVTVPEVVTAYVSACNRYNVAPLNRVIQQLQDLMIERFDERVHSLDLQGEKLSCGQMEALEEIFKRVRFVTVNLENTSLDDESSLPLFDMMEYYDSVRVLNISRNRNISSQGWQSCCRMIKRTRCLEELVACGIPLEEENVRILQRTLKLNPSLSVLRLENCGISGTHLTTLLNGLKSNKTLKELHLANNKMNYSDGIQLSQLLKSNLQLRLLNLSGNDLEDEGISHLAQGLGEQNQVQVLLKLRTNRRGLKSLLLRNTKMTSDSAGSLARALLDNKSLQRLDLGGNNINNEGIYSLKETLMRNRTLSQLKLNDCRITCEGAVALAEYVAENPKIQELDLRDNSIRLGGLLALAQSMKVNQSITKLELDKPSVKDSASEVEQKKKLLLQVSEYSDRNFDILEKKKELETEEEDEELMNDDDDEIVSEPVSKLLSLWSHSPPIRPSSVTCHPPITVSTVAESPPEPGSWQSVRGTTHLFHHHHHHYLRSPQPSPSSSPIPSPTRNRFHVTRVFQELDSSSGSNLSSMPSIVTPTNTPSRMKFTVTPVVDSYFPEQSLIPPPPLQRSSSSCSSPQFDDDERKNEIDELSDNDSVFLDPTEIPTETFTPMKSPSESFETFEKSLTSCADSEAAFAIPETIADPFIGLEVSQEKLETSSGTSDSGCSSSGSLETFSGTSETSSSGTCENLEIISATSESPCATSESGLDAFDNLKLTNDELALEIGGEDNYNGDRDSGIYLLDLSCDDLDTTNSNTSVPNANINNNNCPFKDDSQPIDDRLVDIVEDDQKSANILSNTLAGVDFLSENDCWSSPVNVTGDLITFNEPSSSNSEDNSNWLNDSFIKLQEANDPLVTISSNNNNNNNNEGETNVVNGESFESNGSSDSGVTDSDDVVMLLDESQATCKSEGSQQQISIGSNKMKNGYCNVSPSASDSDSERSLNKRTRTPGCAGSKEVESSCWSA